MTSDNSSSASIAFLGLGSNQGDRAAHLRAAVEAFREREDVTVTGVSPVYETEAHTYRPDDPSPRFLNAVVEIETVLLPEDVLRLAHEVEREEGRQRDGSRWAPRSLDVDLLTYDDERRSEESLTLPHPRLAERRFVLRPWADVAPNFVVPPPFDQSVHALLDECTDPSDVKSTDVSLTGSRTFSSES